MVIVYNTKNMGTLSQLGDLLNIEETPKLTSAHISTINGSECIRELDTICRFFFSESETHFSDKDTNYAPDIRRSLWLLCQYIRHSRDLQVIRGLLNRFWASEVFETDKITDLCVNFQWWEDEFIIQKISELFWISYTEVVSWNKRIVYPLVNIYCSPTKRFYLSDRDEIGLRRPRNGAYLWEAKSIQEVVTDTPAAIRDVIIWWDWALNEDDWVIDTEGNWLQIENPPRSVAKLGRKRRREKSKLSWASNHIQIDDAKLSQTEREKFNNLFLFAVRSLDELRQFWLSQIPIFRDVLEYFRLQTEYTSILEQIQSVRASMTTDPLNPVQIPDKTQGKIAHLEWEIERTKTEIARLEEQCNESKNNPDMTGIYRISLKKLEIWRARLSKQNERLNTLLRNSYKRMQDEQIRNAREAWQNTEKWANTDAIIAELERQKTALEWLIKQAVIQSIPTISEFESACIWLFWISVDITTSNASISENWIRERACIALLTQYESILRWWDAGHLSLEYIRRIIDELAVILRNNTRPSEDSMEIVESVSQAKIQSALNSLKVILISKLHLEHLIAFDDILPLVVSPHIEAQKSRTWDTPLWWTDWAHENLAWLDSWNISAPNLIQTEPKRKQRVKKWTWGGRDWKNWFIQSSDNTEKWVATAKWKKNKKPKAEIPNNTLLTPKEMKFSPEELADIREVVTIQIPLIWDMYNYFSLTEIICQYTFWIQEKNRGLEWLSDNASKHRKWEIRSMNKKKSIAEAHLRNLTIQKKPTASEILTLILWFFSKKTNTDSRALGTREITTTNDFDTLIKDIFCILCDQELSNTEEFIRAIRFLFMYGESIDIIK